MAEDAMSQFIPAILNMLQNPPDPNEPLPLSNRRETIYGVTLPFLVSAIENFLAWASTNKRS
jgi:hypothetical protein